MFAAGDGEALQPSEIDITHKNVEAIRRQLWCANEEQQKTWVLPCAKDGRQNEDRARKVIKEVENGCAICEKRRKVPARPPTGGLVARRPNDIATMDAVELVAPGGQEKVWAIHMLDVATKFSKVFPGEEHVAGKKVVGALMGRSALFGGQPKRLVTGQGPEFMNRAAADYAMNKGVAHLVTPAYTPASNGLIERHNALVTDISYKLFGAVQLE